MGIPLSLPKKGAEPPNFQLISAHVYCGQTVGWIKTALGTEVRLSPSDFVLDGYPAPSRKSGRACPILTHFYCSHRAGCSKVPLGMEVGLSPGDFVLDGNPAPFQKGGGAPQFSAHVCCGQTALHGSRCHLVRRLASAQTTLC